MVALCVSAVPWVLVRLCNQAKTRRQLVGTLASGMRWLCPVRWTWYAASLCSSVVGCEAVVARSLGCPFPWLYVSPLRCLCSVCATPVLATLSVQLWLLSVFCPPACVNRAVCALYLCATLLLGFCVLLPPVSQVLLLSPGARLGHDIKHLVAGAAGDEGASGPYYPLTTAPRRGGSNSPQFALPSDFVNTSASSSGDGSLVSASRVMKCRQGEGRVPSTAISFP
jgi:hypothetical protein